MPMIEMVVRLAPRGDGVTDAGRYVPGTAPGDIVHGEEVTPGPHRALPPCAHFGTCGGCQLQHVDEESLGDFITMRIMAALAGVGIAASKIHPPHLSPPGARRRASLRAASDAGGISIGFNVEGSNRIVDLGECHVVTPAIWTAIQGLRRILPPLVARGTAAGIKLTETASGIDMLLSNVRINAAAVNALAAYAKAHRIARVSADMDGGTDIIVQHAEPFVRIDDVMVALPPGSFLQATRDGERALQTAVLQACTGARHVADLFCGVGTFALPLSRRSRVLASDAGGLAVAALSTAAREHGRAIETGHRDLFRRPYDAMSLARIDAVVLDPPRAGARAQTEELAKSSVPRIAYVSCNPNTFARDAKILIDAGYRLVELWPVGQFRWSVHVELVAAFSR